MADETPTKDPQLWLVPLIGTLGMVVLLALIVKLCGADPREAFEALFQGAFGSKVAWGETLARAVVLTFSGLAIALSFRCGLFNIGAEGQFLLGAAASAFMALKILPESLPWFVGVFCCSCFGIVAGLLWSLIPGFLKQYRGVSEVISSLMLNLTAVVLLKYLVMHQYLLQAAGSNMPKSATFPEVARLPGWSGTAFNSGVFLIVPVAVFIYIFLFQTRAGLSLRATGLNPFAAQAVGIPTRRVMLFVFALTGALAGCGGSLAVMATGHLPETLYPDYGYMAIAVALVARLHPLAVVPSALFFAALLSGAKNMERMAGVPSDVVFLVQGLVILAVLVRGLRLPGK